MPRRRVELSYRELGGAFFRVFSAGSKKRRALVAEFERKFADFIGARYAIAVPSFRTGLSFFFDSSDFAKGDEILLPALNYHVVPAILKNKGMNPVFVDIDPETWTIDPQKVEEKITDRTKGLIALHLFGQSCPMAALRDVCRRHNIFLIEDVAHACGGRYHGKKLGSWGDLAFFSFGTGKALVAFGGGMITTNDENIFLRMKKRIDGLRLPWGVLSAKSFCGALAETVFTRKILFSFFIYPLAWMISLFYPHFIDSLTEDKYVLEEGDVELRSVSMSPFQACLALEQLKKINEFNGRRKKWAARLTNHLKDMPDVKTQFRNENDEHIGLYYSMAVRNPEELRKFLFLNGVDTKRGTMRACSTFEFFQNSSKCSIAEEIGPCLVELPCYPSLCAQDIDYQVDLIRKFYE